MIRHARMTDIRPLRTDHVAVTADQARNLVANPNVTIHDARIIPGGRYRIHVTYATPPVTTHRTRRLPFRIEGGGRYGRTLAVLFGIPALLFTTGWVVSAAWGDQINTALRYLLGAAALILSALLIGSLLIRKTGRCPGLHCTGCGGH